MSLAATYLLGFGLASLVTATVLHDRRQRHRARYFWFGGAAFTAAGAALNAVLDFRAGHPVHAVVTAGIAVLSAGLIVATVRRR